MVNLTFGEQVKIILSRRNMTIKELAEKIEASTGKPMSRQNLTQRLSRDNFQEKDMRLIAEILGCKFQLSIMEDIEEIILPKQPITVGDLLDMSAELELHNERMYQEQERAEKEKLETEAGNEAEAEAGNEAETETETEVETEVEIEVGIEAEIEAEIEEKQEEESEERKLLRKGVKTYYKKMTGVAEKAESGEALQDEIMQKAGYKEKVSQEVLGELNPYTRKEYRNNSVRSHPKRIGYVQVYDAQQHKWTEMTEWAFLGYQERKKKLLGKDYEPPVYLD